MIESVWGLYFKGKLMGLRVLDDDDMYYDLDLSVVKKHVKFNDSALPKLQLMEYGSELMTAEEMSTGVTVEDASSDFDVIDSLVSFLQSRNSTDPAYQRQLKKKFDDLVKSYYTYLPNDWLKEFVQYHLDYFEGNRDIYSGLSKHQLSLVKEYFRFRSRAIFLESKSSGALKKGINKAKQLRSVMGNADDWHYDGSVDTGFKGGSTCELGHPLRYEHYAFSPSLNKHIVFGMTCVTDFFELDKRVIDNIVQAQETLLKEIKCIVFVLRTNRFTEYCTQYTDFQTVLSYPVFNDSSYLKSLVAFMVSFNSAGLPLTRTMLKAFKDMQSNFPQTKKIFDTVTELTPSLGASCDPALVIDVLRGKHNLLLAVHLRHCLLSTDYRSNMPFVTSAFTLLPRLLEISDKGRQLFLSFQIMPLLKRPFYFVMDNGKPRLATKEEILAGGSELTRTFLFNSEKVTMLEFLVTNTTPSSSHLAHRIPFLTFDDYLKVFFRDSDLHFKAVTWFGTPDFLQDFALLEAANGIAKSSPSAPQVKSPTAPVPASAPSVASTVPTSTPSATHEEPEGDPFNEGNDAPKVVLSDSIIELIEAAASGRFPRDAFVFQIIDTVKKTGRVSPKQQQYINEAIVKLRRLY